MQETVGTYRVIFGHKVTAVVPLSKRSRLKEATTYPDEHLPVYIKDYISRKLPYIGFIYVGHADEPIGNPDKPTGQAQHYMGYARDVELRMLRHLAGNGAAIMRAFAERGINVEIVKVWVGDRHFERKLKRQHDRKRFCPKCGRSNAHSTRRRA